MADDLLSGLGGVLGGLFGGLSSMAATQAGVGAISGLTGAGVGLLNPYNAQGQDYLGPTSSNLLDNTVGSQNIGQGRINNPTNPTDFESFAKNYNTSEGAQYLMDTARAAQDDTAAARGGLLSGANLRAQTGIAQGIANQDLLSHFQAMESGQQQDFNQRQAAEQNLVGQENIGLQGATGQAGTLAAGSRGIGSLYQGLSSQANSAGSSFGSGLGSLISGIFGAFK